MSNTHRFVKESYTLSTHQDNFVPDINIAFAIDKNYLRPCGVTLFSITEHNKDLNIDFHIFTTFFDRFGYDEILANNPNIRIHVYILDTQAYDHLQVNGHFTTAIYYRLSIADILKDKVERFLYLDADILCFRSLKKLVQFDLSPYVLAAVQDKCMKKEYMLSIGLDTNKKYFNSGVMFINIAAWHKNDVFNKFNALINEKIYKFPDQDVLNFILSDQVYFLDQEFNYFTQDPIDPVIMHFVSSPKPWNVAAPHSQKYLPYYYKSPWKDIPLDMPRNSKEAKKYAKILWKKGKFFESLKWYLIYINKKLNK